MLYSHRNAQVTVVEKPHLIKIKTFILDQTKLLTFIGTVVNRSMAILAWRFT